jgi:hypothetical protein
VSSSFAFVTIVTFPYAAAFNAKVRPAIPDPITRKSVLFFIIQVITSSKDTNRFPDLSIRPQSAYRTISSVQSGKTEFFELLLQP